MVAACYLLDYYSHLLFFSAVSCPLQILPGPLKVRGCPDSFYCTLQVLQPLFVASFVWNHGCLVDSCKGLEMAVFKKGRGSYGNRNLYYLHYSLQIQREFFRELCIKENREYLIVLLVYKVSWPEVVDGKEGVEQFRRYYDCPWNGDIDIFISLSDSIRLHFHGYEGQASSFSSQRAFTYSREKEGFVIAFPVELGNGSSGSLFSVAFYCRVYKLPCLLGIASIAFHCNRLED